MKKKLISIISIVLATTAFCSCGDKKDQWDSSAAEESSLAMPAEDNSKAYQDDARVIYTMANTTYTNLEVAGNAPASGDITVDMETDKSEDTFIQGLYDSLDMNKYKGKCIVHITDDEVAYIEYIPSNDDKVIYPKEKEGMDSSSDEESESSEETAKSTDASSLSDESRLEIQSENAIAVEEVIEEFCRDMHEKNIILEEKQYFSDDGSDLAKYVNENMGVDCVWTTYLEPVRVIGYRNSEEYIGPSVTYTSEDLESHYMGSTLSDPLAPFVGTLKDIVLKDHEYERGRFIAEDGILTDGDPMYDFETSSKDK